MKLTAAELEQQRDDFRKRTARFDSAGYDRFGAAESLVDDAGALDGPALDVGTGMGITARALARRGLEVVSIDTNAHDQQVAAFLTEEPRLSARIHFTLADAALTPFADGQFGCAVAVDVLHHLDAGAPVLTELVRVIKPGGIVFLADFSREGFEMVSRVHAAEGRVHAEGPVTMDWARGYLCGLGLTELKASQGHLHRASVLRTPSRVEVVSGPSGRTISA